MNLYFALKFLFEKLQDIFSLLNSYTFDIGSLSSVSLAQIFLGFICLSLIISFFWKGARG